MKSKNKFFRFTFYLALISLLLLGGCGLGANEQGENARSGNGGENTEEPLPNDSSTDVTDSGSVVDLDEYDDEHALWKKTEYDAPTGKWFLHNGSGHFGYGMPHGTFRAGDEFAVHLYGHNPDGETLQRTIRITLTERSNDFENLQTVIEEDVFIEVVEEGDHEILSAKLPEKENVKYVLSVQIVNDAGEVEDTLLSMLKVPAEEINATLHTDKEVYSDKDKELTLIVKNEGPTDLFFGVYYSIEKLVDGEWEEIFLDTAFIDIGIQLPDGKEYEQKINIEPLKPGSYRIYKDVMADGLDLKERLMVEFTVN